MKMAKSGALKLADKLFETHPELLHSNAGTDPKSDEARMAEKSGATLRALQPPFTRRSGAWRRWWIRRQRCCAKIARWS